MNYINTIISVSLVLVAFIFYYFLSSLEIIKNYFIKKLGEEQGQIRIILFQRLTGILFFGSIPAFFLLYRNSSSTIESFLKIQFNLSSLAFIIIFVVTAFFLNYFAARSPENLAIYPQIRSKTWSLSLLILSGLSWMTYLFAYEFLFRGLLLFFCIEELGVVLALIVNIFLYSLVHIPKGRKETIGAIPMGIILCILTIHSGTIWMAFWIHCSLALSNEWLSIKYHPDMKILIHKE